MLTITQPKLGRIRAEGSSGSNGVWGELENLMEFREGI